MTISPGDRAISIPGRHGAVAVGFVPPAAGDAVVIVNGIAQRYTLPSPGDHVVLIPVTGGSPVAIRTAGNALPAAPAAGFSGTPLSGLAPLVVAFTDTSTGSPAMWYWSFGDGTHSALRHPQHVYATGGIFTVSLKASNTGGAGTMTRPAYISVYTPAAFDYGLLSYFTVNGTVVPDPPAWSGAIGTLPGGAILSGWMLDATGPAVELAAAFTTAGLSACRFIDFDIAYTGTPFSGYGSWAVVNLSGTSVAGGAPVTAGILDPVAGHYRIDLGELCDAIAISWSGVFANDPAGSVVSIAVSGIAFST
jgi:PKD repeat protein